MTMVFEELAIDEGSAAGFVRLQIGGFGYGFSVSAGDAVGAVRLVLAAFGEGYGYTDDVDVLVPANGSSALYLGAAGEGFSEVYSDGIAELVLGAVGYGVEDGYGAGAHGFQIASTGVGFSNLDGYALLVERPPIISSFGDMQFVNILDQVVLNAQQNPLPTYVLRDFLALQAPSIQNKYEGTAELRDALVLSEDLDYTLIKSILASLVLNGAATPTFTTYVRVMESLVLGGYVRNEVEAYAKILDALVFNAVAEMLTRVTITDTMVLNGQVDVYYTLFAKILDTLVLQSTLSADSLAVAVVLDTVLFNADLSHEADLTALIMDSVSFATTLSIDNGEYIAWVINTENTALSRYTNYPFNSFAKIGDSYVGAASDGLHTLDGDDDNGDAINARLRQGLSDMGSRKLKQIPEAYIGASVDGQLLMQVITVDERTGTKKGAIYKMANRGAVVNRENRIQFGKGLKSVDWDWILENVDGADFDIGSIEFRPLFLTRRTRG